MQTLVMSLWGVSDWTTKEFMVHFYRNLTENGWNKRKALKMQKHSYAKLILNLSIGQALLCWTDTKNRK